jgi:hypothetical protein
MSGPGVGFEYPVKEVSWTKRDVLLFANSIGATSKELHFLYVRLLLSTLMNETRSHTPRNCTPTSPSSPPTPSS